MIVPMFQGIHCARTGERVGAEALARWFWHGDWSGPLEHPMFPAWPKVDQASLRFLIRNAHVVAAQYPAISINVCPDTLNSEDTFRLWREMVTALLEKADLKLVAEVTERVSDQLLADSWDKLADLNVPLYMDDFGHQFSTLSRLQEYPWDGCKFNIKTISATPDCPGTESALSLCHDQGINTVAEQVETQHLLAKARQLEFDWLQGFHFGRAQMLMQSGEVCGTHKACHY